MKKTLIIIAILLVATFIPVRGQSCSGVPAAVVIGSGTQRVNGLYTCRGFLFSRPFFTRADQPTDTDLYAITHSLGTWYISDFQTDVVYYSNDLAFYPWEVSNWVVTGSGSAPGPQVFPFKTLRSRK